MDPCAANLASAPAEEEVALGPWRLRRGSGGRRTMAATLEGRLGEGDVAAAIAAMRRWGQRPVFQVREDESGLDAALAAAGLVLEGETVLLAADATVLAHRRADLSVIDCDGPLAVAVDLWAAAGIGAERLRTMARVAGPKRYLLGRAADRPAAAAFVSLAGGAVVVNALEVVPAARRQGLGRRIMQWAGAWGTDLGAGAVVVAVETANAPALDLYRGLGMRQVGRYHYRVLTG